MLAGGGHFPGFCGLRYFRGFFWFGGLVCLFGLGFRLRGVESGGQVGVNGQHGLLAG
jgi:hypothetical protein